MYNIDVAIACFPSFSVVVVLFTLWLRNVVFVPECRSWRTEMGFSLGTDVEITFLTRIV